MEDLRPLLIRAKAMLLQAATRSQVAKRKRTDYDGLTTRSITRNRDATRRQLLSMQSMQASQTRKQLP